MYERAESFNIVRNFCMLVLLLGCISCGFKAKDYRTTFGAAASVELFVLVLCEERVEGTERIK